MAGNMTDRSVIRKALCMRRPGADPARVPRWPFALAWVASVLAAGCGAIADEREALGPFELVTHTHRYLTGYNEGELRLATTESYSLRHAGKPFTFVGRAGMDGETTATYTRVNALVTFPSPEPVVVVNVGDPNNTSFYYLVRERGGDAVAEYLG